MTIQRLKADTLKWSPTTNPKVLSMHEWDGKLLVDAGCFSPSASALAESWFENEGGENFITA